MLILLIRDGFLITMAGLVIIEMWHPEEDIVRMSGLDDPGGGVFDGLPDDPRFVLGRHEVAEDDTDIEVTL